LLPEKNSLHFSFYFALKFLTSKTSLVTLKLHILKGKNILAEYKKSLIYEYVARKDCLLKIFDTNFCIC